jgi:hypothetical protein
MKAAELTSPQKKGNLVRGIWEEGGRMNLPPE